MAKRDLEFYLNNPSDLPSDPDQLAAIEEELNGGEPIVAQEDESDVEQGEKGATPGATAVEGEGDSEKGKAQSKDDEAAPQSEPDDKPVVLSKSGKHTIPYSALEAERHGRQEAERALQQLQEQLAQLQDQVAGKTDATADKPAAEADFTDEDLEAMAEQFPEAGKVIKGLAKTIGHLQEQLERTAQSEHQRRQSEQTTAAQRVQAAIDETPALRHWQSEDPQMFEIAKGFDAQIKADPRNRGLTLEERFSKVVKAVEAVYGPARLPGEPADDAETPAAKPSAQADTKRVAEKVEQKLKAASERQPVTLSDMPGGTPPGASELDEFDSMSPAQLEVAMMKMPPEKLQQLLSRLG